MNLFSIAGQPDQVLILGLVSGNGGLPGLLLFDGERVSRLDSIATAGALLVGDCLVRLLGSDTAPDSSGELVVYDTTGVQAYVRIPRLSDAHDMAWDGQHLLCTATGNNTLLWLSQRGEVARRWHAPGENDAWHLNGVHHCAGTTYISAFGVYAQHREWDKDQFAHSGVIYDVTHERVELSGLDSPHNPMLVEEGLLVCNSGSAELLNFDVSSRRLRRRLQLNAWTRGLTCSERYLFVGESANRKNLTAGASARLCIVDRRQWRVLDRFAVPGTEITFLALVPRKFVPALKRGFPGGLSRHAGDGLLRHAGCEPLYRPGVTWPLPPDACRIAITASLPDPVQAGGQFAVLVKVQNKGTGVLSSAPPCPVHVACRWYKLNWDGEKAAGDNIRTRVPADLLPGQIADCELTVFAPREPGSYRVQISLVQENVVRFDDVRADNAYSSVLSVVSGNAQQSALRRLPMQACSWAAKTARRNKRALQMRLLTLVHHRLRRLERRMLRSRHSGD